MRRRSAMTLGLLFLGSGVLGLSHEAAGQGGGMTMLSDGTNIENFAQAGNANWRVGERTIYADRGVGFLVTKQSYGDFRLRAEVWVDDIANSGIFIRCDDPEQPGANTCYEVNIWDTRPDPAYGTGAIVNVAKVNPMPKAGLNWNVMEIEARGTQLTVKLNGKQTVSVSDSKHARGRIAFQYGQGVVRWRKIEIQPL
jgi:3-keto-disaccharide hydrolase